MTNNNLKNLLIKEPNINILLHVYRNDNSYTTQVANSIDLSRPHTDGIINDMVDQNLLEKDHGSHKKFLELTDKGKELAKEFERLNQVFKEVKNYD